MPVGSGAGSRYSVCPGVYFELVVVKPPLGHHLDHRQGLGAEHADGDFGAGDELLDQHQVIVAQRLVEAGAQLRRAPRTMLTPMVEPSRAGLTTSG